MKCLALARVAQLVRVSSYNPKVVDSILGSRHMPGLRVQSPMGGNQSMFLSQIDVSLSLPPSLFKINRHKKKKMK